MKLRKPKKPVNIRRKGFQGLVAVLLGIVFLIVFTSVWYALYVDIMPSVNSFLFGLMGGASVLGTVSADAVPYTVIALWGIPALLMCATLNVLCWKFSILWFKVVRKAYRFMMRKFDENAAKAEKASEKAK